VTAGPEVSRDLSEKEADFDLVFDPTVADVLRVPTVRSDDMELDAAGLDSFSLLNLMMAVEDESGGMWPLEHLTMSARVATVGDLRLAARRTRPETPGEPASRHSATR
jgi:acyl carrier protein